MRLRRRRRRALLESLARRRPPRIAADLRGQGPGHCRHRAGAARMASRPAAAWAWAWAALDGSRTSSRSTRASGEGTRVIDHAVEMTESFATGVNDPSATAAARRSATALAVKLGFDEPDVGRVALVVTELATNLLKHAGGGEILVRSGMVTGPVMQPASRSWHSIAGQALPIWKRPSVMGTRLQAPRHRPRRDPSRVIRVRRLLRARYRHRPRRRAPGAISSQQLGAARAPGHRHFHRENGRRGLWRRVGSA